MLRGVGCPKCSHNLRLSHEEYVERIKKINPYIKITSQYIKSADKIKYICLKCGYQGKTDAASLLRGVGCPSCSGKVKFTQRKFEDVMKERSCNLQMIGQYRGARNKIKYRCLVCGYEGEAKAYHLLEGQGCPICCVSKGERCIMDFLIKNNIRYEIQKGYDDLVGVNMGKLLYDFYLPDYNLLIEYQGEQHRKIVSWFDGERGFEIRQEHDYRKRKYAEQHNIQLLEIWYNENIEQKLKETLNLETVETAGV